MEWQERNASDDEERYVRQKRKEVKAIHFRY